MSSDTTEGATAPDSRTLRRRVFEAIRESGPGPTVSAATDAALAVFQGELAELSAENARLARLIEAEAAEIEGKRTKRDAEMGRLRAELKRERTFTGMAERLALEADAERAGSEARYATLNARHRRAVADHRKAADAITERAEKAEADLAEMTLCRDNAVRAAQHADQSIDVDLEGLVADWVAELGIEWTHGTDDRRLAGGFVDLVRPVIAHAVKRAEGAEAERDEQRAELEAERRQVVLLLSDVLPRCERRAERAEDERDRLRTALEEVALRTVQRDLSQIAKAALAGRQDGDGDG